jgi:hypothetical protein
MDRYQRVEKPREDAPIKENEIRITTQGRMRNYITYATALLQVPHLLARSTALSSVEDCSKFQCRCAFFEFLS